MRIATWNVNSLKARLEKVVWWLDRARPDVLLMQETKLADADAPAATFKQAGYELAHHGEGRWNGVAIASRVGIAEVISNFGQPLRAQATPEVPDDEPLAEARMISAVCGGVRVVSLYAPNGRSLDSPFYQAKLAWYERLARWLAESRDPGEAMALGGDYNVAPGGRRRVGPRGLPRRDPRLGARARASSPSSAAGGSSISIACDSPSPAATPGGTIAPATSTRTSGCGSTTCSSPSRSPGGRWPSRSTAKPGRASPCPRTTRPCSSISTSPGTSSIRAGSRRSSRHHSSASAIRRLCQRGSPR